MSLFPHHDDDEHDATGPRPAPTMPLPRDWSVRYGGCPWLEGGMDEQVERLRRGLRAIEASDGAFTTEIGPPDGPSRTIGWFSRHLGSSGLLVSQGQGHVKVSDEARQWLESGDDRLLIGILHSRVLLLGEILQILVDKPALTHEQLGSQAVDMYGLDWKTLDPIRKRLGWLRSLRYVDFSFDRTLTVTDAGRDALACLSVVTPDDARRAPTTEPVEALDLPASIDAMVGGLQPDELRNRKTAFGYIPRSDANDVYDSLRWLCLLFDPSITKDEFVSRCSVDLGIKESSGVGALYALRSLGLVEQFSMDGFRLTPVARDWIDSESRLPIVAIVHAHIALVGELLPLMVEVLRAPELREAINVTYGTQLVLAEVRTRLHLLTACGATEQLAPGRYRATASGRALAKLLPLLEGEVNDPDDMISSSSPATATSGANVGDLVSELREASTDSQNPTRFEVAAQKCLEAMGFRAEHLGGPGRTDVLVHYTPVPGESKRFIVDTKSSASGTVGDSVVQFDALRDHLKKHRAEFAVLLAPKFADGRIISWAAENKVALIDVSRMATLLQNESRVPAGQAAVVDLFRGATNAWENLSELWRSQDRANDGGVKSWKQRCW